MALVNSLDTVRVTITISTSLSPAVDVGRRGIVRIAMLSGWNAAVLTFQTSGDDGVTWRDLYDSADVEVSVTTTASRVIAFELGTSGSMGHLRGRSGTAPVPVVQTAARDLLLIVRPF